MLFGLYSTVLSSLFWIAPIASSQITPDTTLGKQNSWINRIDSNTIHIEGGASFDSNLFHSFSEFNVQELQSVYFKTNSRTENILARVTGDKSSSILGKLGVFGSADLYLINPNGIHFGKSASLDIKGSFIATTNDGIRLGESNVFSAVDPTEAPLLSVQPGALYTEAMRNYQRTIISHGHLEVGKDLILSAHDLELSGSLIAGKSIFLHALQNLRIADTSSKPFLAKSGDQQVINGSKLLDIFALNHPESGFYAGGDLILKSENPVKGDAHYWTRGKFRIESNDGGLNYLQSPSDPIIRSNGDVEIAGFIGTSLHIFSGGKVDIPLGVIIVGPDSVNGLQESIQLSSGKVITIDGRSEPTVDIRAGLDPSAIGSPIGLVGDGSFFPPATLSDQPTSADINIGIIEFTDLSSDAPLAGTVYLSNQYQANPSLQGSITLGRPVQLSGLNQGGRMHIDSRNDIVISAPVNAVSLAASGSIDLLAKGSLSIADQARIITGNGSETLLPKVEEINIKTSSLKLGEQSAIISLTSGLNNSANIVIDSSQIDLGIGAEISTITTGRGNAGQINVSSSSLFLGNGALIASVTRNIGNAGDILIRTNNSLSLNQSELFSSAAEGSEGNAGVLRIDSPQIQANNSSIIGSQASGRGRVGGIQINAVESISLHNSRIIVNAASSSVGETGSLDPTLPNSENINVKTSNLKLSDQAKILSFTGGPSNARNIAIDSDLIDLESGAEISSITSGRGNAGQISVKSSSLSLGNGALIASVTRNIGKAGDVWIRANNSLSLNQSELFSAALAGSEGDAGVVRIDSPQIQLDNQSFISSQTRGLGKAGNVYVSAEKSISLTNSNIYTTALTSSTGDTGSLDITTGELSLTNNASIYSTTSGQGKAGDININANNILLNDYSDITVSSNGSNSGNIDIRSNNLTLFNESEITAFALNKGSSGNIILQLDQSLFLDNSLISTGVDSSSSGNAGSILVSADQLLLNNKSFLSTITEGNGDAGSVILNARDNLQLDNSYVTAAANPGSTGNAGDIILVTPDLRLNNRAEITTAALNGTLGNAGSISISTDQLFLNNQSFLNAVALGAGNAGDIAVNVGDNLFLDNSTITASSTSSGNSGSIFIEAKYIHLQSGSNLAATASGIGKAGSIDIDANSISLDRSDLLVGTAGPGAAGTINLSSSSLSLVNGSTLAATTGGSGNAGDINIWTHQSLLNKGDVIAGSAATGNAGNIYLLSEKLLLTNGSSIAAATSNAGNAGDVYINSDELSLNTDSLISTATTGSGNAGSISLFAKLINAEQSSIIAGTLSSGNAGNIGIQSSKLSLENGSLIAAGTAGSGDAGTISIWNTGALQIVGGSSNETRSGVAVGVIGPNAKGNGGTLSILTDSLLMKNGALILGGTTGHGNAGNVFINAISQVVLDDPGRDESRIAVESSSQGNAGSLFLTTVNLLIRNGSVISASTTGQGNAGNIVIDVAKNIVLQGYSGSGKPSIIEAASKSSGSSGQIDLSSTNLLISNGAQISANSTADGSAGSININAHESVALVNSGMVPLFPSTTGIFVRSEGTSDAGSITIRSGQISVASNSEVSVSSTRTGNGGELRVFGYNLFQDRGRLTAETEAGTGGNILIQLQDHLLLRNNSLISAESRGSGFSGNIDISAPFILSVPDENSDIIATSIRGGNVTISTDGIFGTTLRQALTPNSDITATGVFTLITPTANPASSLAQLPSEAVDVDNLISRNACAIQNDRIARGSSFLIRGRGGLPPTPADLTMIPEGSVQWIQPQPQLNLSPNKRTASPLPSVRKLVQRPLPKIRQAQGWHRDNDGTIRLTANDPMTEHRQTHNLTPDCTGGSGDVHE
jgi:filamentous hemagglutinin family protein